MPYVRTPEILGFQRWVVWGYDKTVPWPEWQRSRYQGRPFYRPEQEMLAL